MLSLRWSRLVLFTLVPNLLFNIWLTICRHCKFWKKQPCFPCSHSMWMRNTGLILLPQTRDGWQGHNRSTDLVICSCEKNMYTNILPVWFSGNCCQLRFHVLCTWLVVWIFTHSLDSVKIQLSLPEFFNTEFSFKKHCRSCNHIWLEQDLALRRGVTTACNLCEICHF